MVTDRPATDDGDLSRVCCRNPACAKDGPTHDAAGHFAAYSYNFCWPARTLNALQFATDPRPYDPTQFDKPYVQRRGAIDPDPPTGLQPQRARAIFAVLGDDTEPGLLAERAKLVTAELAAGRRVFVVEPVNGRSMLARPAVRHAGRRRVGRVGRRAEAGRADQPPADRRADPAVGVAVRAAPPVRVGPMRGRPQRRRGTENSPQVDTDAHG